MKINDAIESFLTFLSAEKGDTAMCMCMSGYLSTHVAMMDSLGCKKLTGKAILSHTIGGVLAGVFAHLLYSLIALI